MDLTATLATNAVQPITGVEIPENAMFDPVVDGEQRLVREQYQEAGAWWKASRGGVREQHEEAGAHQLIFILDSPAPATWERQLTGPSKTWLS
jgi:hypothetical protein